METWPHHRSSRPERTRRKHSRRALAAAVTFAWLLPAIVLGFGASAGTAPSMFGIQVSGTIGALPGTADLTGDWTVGGKTVHVTSSTILQTGGGTPAVGDFAIVKGTTQTDGSVNASLIVVFDLPIVHPIDFLGTITALPGTADLTGDWTVSGKTVHVTGTTMIDQHHATAAVGAPVEVRGTLQSDGSVDALAIEVLATPPNVVQVEFHGLIQALPGTADLTGDWTVGGKTVHVAAPTRIDQSHGTAQVGAEVEVRGTLQSDGSVDAASIEVISPPPGSVFVEFKGIVKTLPGTADFTGDWTVGGTTVHVTSSTKIDQTNGAPVVGAVVEVKGTARADGSVDATIIIVLFTTPPPVRIEFRGIVATLPGTSDFTGDWMVSGRTVHVTSATMLDQHRGPIAVGAADNVAGTLESDGSIDAGRIEVIEPAGGQIFVEFKGPITTLPATSDLTGDWVVIGVTVHVAGSTVLDPGKGTFAVGIWVRVEGLLNADGTVNALRISLDDGEGMWHSFIHRH